MGNTHCVHGRRGNVSHFNLHWQVHEYQMCFTLSQWRWIKNVFFLIKLLPAFIPHRAINIATLLHALQISSQVRSHRINPLPSFLPLSNLSTSQTYTGISKLFTRSSKNLCLVFCSVKNKSLGASLKCSERTFFLFVAEVSSEKQTSLSKDAHICL